MRGADRDPNLQTLRRQPERDGSGEATRVAAAEGHEDGARSPQRCPPSHLADLRSEQGEACSQQQQWRGGHVVVHRRIGVRVLVDHQDRPERRGVTVVVDHAVADAALVEGGEEVLVEVVAVDDDQVRVQARHGGGIGGTWRNDEARRTDQIGGHTDAADRGGTTECRQLVSEGDRSHHVAQAHVRRRVGAHDDALSASPTLNHRDSVGAALRRGARRRRRGRGTSASSGAPRTRCRTPAAHRRAARCPR